MELRLATRDDIAEMHRIRMAVRENRLVSTVITLDDYANHLAGESRSWVAVLDGRIAGFAVGDLARANIWALFVDPLYEGLGIGRALHDVMLAWMHETVPVVWLTTERGTRAERFYREAGWRDAGTVGVEVRLELAR
jgi:GNAT superfamily N-acetyltransferase